MLVLFIVLLPLFASGETLILQSFPLKLYDEAIEGYSSISKSKVQIVITSGVSDTEIAIKAHKLQPKMILVLGQDALAKSRLITSIPIVYIMVLNPQPFYQGADNITGVSMLIDPGEQLSKFRLFFPTIKNIGVLFDPAKSEDFIGRAKRISYKFGIFLLPKVIHNPTEVASTISAIKDKVDALWMIPDTTVINLASIDSFLLTSINYHLPVLTFSSKYTEKGALISIEIDPFDIGRQAGEIYNMIMSGIDVKNIKKTYTRDGSTTVNLLIAKKLNILVNHNALDKAKVVR